MKALVEHINNTYLVSLVNEYSTMNVMINNVRYDLFKNGQLLEKPTEIFNIIQRNELKGYRGKDGVIISPEEFREQKKVLIQEGALSSHDEESIVWKSLEAEFAFRKYTDQYEPVFEMTETLEAIPIVYCEYAQKEVSCYIKPIRLVGSAWNQGRFENDHLYSYDPNLYKMAQEIAEEMGFKEVDDSAKDKDAAGKKWCVPNHSKDSLRFMRINNTYINMEKKSSFQGIHAGTLKECEERLNSHVGVIKSEFENQKTLIAAKGVSVDAQKILIDLESFLIRLNNINVKRDSVINMSYIQKDIQALIDDVKAAA